MKILAIDYGEKRVGLAIGDNETNLALPAGVLENLTKDELILRLQEIVEAEEIEKVIVGDPIGLDGKETEQTKISRQFTDMLIKNLSVAVELSDERLTSRQAAAAVYGAGAPVRNKDELAAMFLLQDYLENKSANTFSL